MIPAAGILAAILSSDAATRGVSPSCPDPAVVSFLRPPTARAVGDQVEISFMLSAQTDVEVTIVDGLGRVVRHLAAGRLGGALEQTLVWDRRDDSGNTARGAAFQARIAAGTRAKLEKILGWDPNNMDDEVVGLAVGPKGELFVLSSYAWYGRTSLKVFSREGKYSRTIMPYPSDTPRSRTSSVGHLEIEGERLPVVFNGHNGNLYPLVSGIRPQTMAISPKGHLLVVGGIGTMAEHGPPRHLLAVSAAGGAPDGVEFVGPMIRKAGGPMGGAGEAYARCFDHLAISPDGKRIYLTTSTVGEKKPRNAVFRPRWEDKEIGAPWIEKDLNDPQGLATDAKGNLFVCDRGNNRVRVYSEEGLFLREFAAERPAEVAVHPRSGEIYVLSKGEPIGRSLSQSRLIKYSPQGKETARLEKPARLFALDSGRSPPALWIVSGEKGNEIIPVTDRGGVLEPGTALNSAGGLEHPMFFAVDPRKERLVVRERRGGFVEVDPLSGKIARLGVKGTDLQFDQAGNMYVKDGYGTNSLSRYDPAGKALAFSGTGTNKLEVRYRGYGPNLGERGHCVGKNGDIYVVRSSNYGGSEDYGGRVDVFGPDGKFKKKDLIRGMGYGDCGIGVDGAGNVYVGMNLKPPDEPYPKPFMGRIPPQGWAWWSKGKREPPWDFMYLNPYLFFWGSVLKFGPQGGAAYGLSRRVEKGDPGPTADPKNAPPGAKIFRSSYLGREVKVAGAEWSYLGYGIVPGSEDGPAPDPGCVCWTSRLAVDEFGRVFLPNTFRFCVEVLDSNGNLIARVGRYGNADSAGPGSLVPDPEIAFAWPAFVAVGHGKLYVSDSVNRRLSVIRLEHAAHSQCPVPDHDHR